MQKLAFSDDRHIEATIDGEPLDRALGHRGMTPLRREEWRITARTLQGWMPQELGLDREEWAAISAPTQGGWYGSTPARAVTRVVVTLPGGDRPEVLADDVDDLISRDSVPLLGCECGGGIGCAHESVDVSFERNKVRWHHGPLEFVFARAQYNRAIKDLLTRLGESPRLISSAEWCEPARTRVVAGSEWPRRR